MNLKELPFFKNISDSSFQKFKKKCVLYKFKIGQPMSVKDNIPNEILIIAEGEARLVSQEGEEYITIAKLSPGNPVGLASLLTVKGCEEVFASNELKAIGIPQSCIVDLYENEENFKDFCDCHIFPAELLALTKNLIKSSPRTDIKLRTAFNFLAKSAQPKLLSVYNKSILKKEKDYTTIISSANFENLTIGNIVGGPIEILIRPPFAGRLLQIKNEAYNLFTTQANAKSEIAATSKNSQAQRLDESSIEADKEIEFSLTKSVENIGQYKPEKPNLFIKGRGEVGESLACLQMLAQKLDAPFRKDSIEKILRDEIRRGRKPSIDLSAALISMLGLHAAKAIIKSKSIKQLPTPCLISYQNTFCIISETNEDFITLLSPKDGEIKLTSDKIADSFEDELSVLIVDRKTNTPNINFNINWFIPSLKKYKGVLLQVLVASFIVQLFGLANPLLIQVIIDKVISQRSLDTLQVLGIALVFVTILGGILGSLRTFLFTETTNRIDARLGSEVIDHLLRLPLNYFDKRPVGELGSRVAELEKIRNFLTGQALTTILDAAFSVIYIIVMVLYSWLLTLIALGVLPIQIILTLIGSPLLRRQIRQSAEQNAKTQSHLVEVLTGVQTVKAQNVETVSRWKWQELYGKYISHTFEKTITTTALSQTSQVLQQLSQLLVLWVGATLVLQGNLTLGQLIAFRIISGYVTQPLLRLSSIWQSIQELRVSFERLADIIDTQEESNQADKANIPLPQIEGSVKFKNVSFTFQDGTPNVLNNVNLEIKKGKFVGIAGQSGSGKSTLMKLLPRLYNTEKGKIIIDEYDISKVELYSLRRQIGIVPQDPLLFSGTISDNISLVNPDIDSDSIVEAAKIADAHDFIMNLPQGYSTNVGERGAGLSGGQRQRIAIARTLISRPRMLIMDEATSALDYQTERKVCENLRNFYKNLTVFFITHRLSTIKNADMVIMMHEGSISETGTHDELIEKRGRYFALFRQQEAQ